MNQKKEKPQQEEETRTKKTHSGPNPKRTLGHSHSAGHRGLRFTTDRLLAQPSGSRTVQPYNRRSIPCRWLLLGWMVQCRPVPREGTQTRRLVTSGAYRYTRTPMVFGYLLIWIGLGFLFNSLFHTIGVTSIVTAGLIAFVKLWEEKNLEKRFGEPYIQYKKKVSFLIPLPP